jgi:3-hydroxymyristoyl/3-hydroxydecanoyl-(acyl carrier protein) dehydratase
MTTVPDPSDKLVFFASINNVKFRKPVVPGDRLVFELTTRKMKGKLCVMSGEAFVDGQTVAEAEFMAMLVDKSPQNP